MSLCVRARVSTLMSRPLYARIDQPLPGAWRSGIWIMGGCGRDDSVFEFMCLERARASAQANARMRVCCVRITHWTFFARVVVHSGGPTVLRAPQGCQNAHTDTRRHEKKTRTGRHTHRHVNTQTHTSTHRHEHTHARSLAGNLATQGRSVPTALLHCWKPVPSRAGR